MMLAYIGSSVEYTGSMSAVQPVPVRARNPRGRGDRLRSDVVAAARRMLEETGQSDAVTLRGIARRIGVAAPSIYAHFFDRDAVLAAVVDEGFQQLRLTVEEARATASDPVDRLMAGCRAYLHFAWQRRALYELMFAVREPAQSTGEPEHPDDAGAAAFAVLVAGINQCVDAGRCASDNPRLDAAAVLVALHGYALLRPKGTTLAWPQGDELTTRLVTTLARIDPARGGAAENVRTGLDA